MAKPDSPRIYALAHRPKLRIGLGIGASVLFILIFVWRWDWFIPMIDRLASQSLQRKVTISHLHVRPGLTTTIKVEGLKIDQPQTFAKETPPFASIKHAIIAFSVWDFIKGKGLNFPLINLDAPRANLVSRVDGTNNFTFVSQSKNQGKDEKETKNVSLPQVGTLIVKEGGIHLLFAKPHAKMNISLETGAQNARDGAPILIKLDGTYDRAPISGRITGGSLGQLTKGTSPYPITAHVENGRTVVELKGVIDDPLHFKGTNLKLKFYGPDMALLYGLTAIPIPHTPAYSVEGQLAYSANQIQFRQFTGRLGASDIGGTIVVNPNAKPINVDARLKSRLIDLSDLGGFIGAKRGVAKETQSKSSGKFLPSDPINVPKLDSINAHLLYHGDRIKNKHTPFDNIDADILIQDGHIAIRKLNYGVGSGRLSMRGKLSPTPEKQFATVFHVDVSRLPIDKLVKAAGNFGGSGVLGGHFSLRSTGNSVATLLGNGNGDLALVVDHGGDISALLPDLLGLKIGSAILSALGIPNRSALQCFVVDMPLRNGVLDTKAFLLQTDATRTLGGGTVDLKNESLHYHVTTRSTSFNVLSFPGRVNIAGTLASPSITPGAEIIGRAAATAGLAVAFPPALILPTIQFGVGKGSLCEKALNSTGPSTVSTGKGPSQRAATSQPKTAETHGRNAHKTKILSPSHIRKIWQEKQKNAAAKRA